MIKILLTITLCMMLLGAYQSCSTKDAVQGKVVILKAVKFYEATGNIWVIMEDGEGLSIELIVGVDIENTVKIGDTFRYIMVK